MNRLRWVSAVSLLAIVGSARTAFGGPPFVTDDPEPVDYHHWEFYVASQDSKYGHDFSGTGPHFELNYGAVPDLQLHTIVPIAYDVSPADRTVFGIGDIELGAKYRFIHEGDRMPEIGAFPLLEIPTGSVHETLGNGHMQAFLPIWAQKNWDTWSLYGGGGYGINSFSGPGNWGFFGAVLQKQLTKNVLVGLELFHQTVYEVDFPNKGTGFNVGTVIDFSDQHHLLLSAGRSISGPINFQFYIAYQFTFDNSLFKFWSQAHN